jgi:putative GTP pyrophosphokinase
MENAKLISEFKQKKHVFEKYRDKLDSLINDILSVSKLFPHQITCRVKDEESISRKIKRKEGKYSSLNEITDIVGIRIITYFEDDVDKIAEIIKREFAIDQLNSVDKRIVENDKFGYRSLHYIISFSEDRLGLIENKFFLNLKAEIQIRSILQHAWAEIEHDIGYKGEIEIPQFAKRNFYRIAALLETADIEFVKLKNTLKEYETTISKSIEENPEDVLIDKTSLNKYIRESYLVKNIDLEIKKILKSKKIDVDDNDFNILLLRLSYFKVSTIKQLDTLLKKYQKVIPLFLIDFLPYALFVYKNSLPKGICIFHLTFLLAAKDNDLNIAVSFCNEFMGDDKNAQQLINSYKKVSQK